MLKPDDLVRVTDGTRQASGRVVLARGRSLAIQLDEPLVAGITELALFLDDEGRWRDLFRPNLIVTITPGDVAPS